MPDRKKIEIGDSIKILKVPNFDEKKRTENNKNKSDVLCTATVIETIIKKNPIVIIDHIDEYNQPWFSVRIKIKNTFENHTIALLENDSWEVFYKKNNDIEPPKEHKIAEIQKFIDILMDEYEEEYLSLTQESEKLYEKQKKLKKKYEALDKKTGLNDLFSKLAELKETKK